MPGNRAKLEAELGAAQCDFRESVAAVTGAINEKVANAKKRICPPILVVGVGAAFTIGFALGAGKKHTLDPLVALAAAYLGISIVKRARGRDSHEA